MLFKLKHYVFLGTAMVFGMQLFATIDREPAVLWRVSDGDSHVYLLGSVHLLRPTDYPLRDIYSVAFDQVEGLAIEADVSQQSAMTRYVEDHAFYPSGTLSQDFSFATITKIRTWFRQQGYQFSSKYQPWFLATLVLEVEVLSQGPFTADGVDMHFLELANNRGLTVEYLESWQVALDNLISMPPEIAEQSILELIKSSDETISELHNLVDHWKQSDLAAMEYYIEEEYDSGPQNPFSLAGRNLSWMPAIRGYLEEDRKFMIVVGAGHMVGEYGLPQLLADEGYQVERLPEPTWATLESPTFDANTNTLELGVKGAMGHVCVIETTTDLKNPNSWSRFDSFILTDGQTEIEVPYAPSAQNLFIRGRIIE